MAKERKCGLVKDLIGSGRTAWCGRCERSMSDNDEANYYDRDPELKLYCTEMCAQEDHLFQKGYRKGQKDLREKLKEVLEVANLIP